MKAIRTLWQSVNKRVLFMVGLLLIIWVVFNYLSGGYILRAENMANLFRQVTVVALLSVAMTLVIVSGNIDLSVGSALGMFGALGAMFMTQMGLHPVVAVLLVLCMGVCVGCLHGWLIHYLNIPAFVVTLGGLIAYRGITQYIARQSIPLRVEWVKAIARDAIPNGLTLVIVGIVIVVLLVVVVKKAMAARNATGAPVLPMWVEMMKTLFVCSAILAVTVLLVSGTGFPISFAIMLGVTIVVSAVARYTRFGHYVYAVGGNKQAALYSGIPIPSTIIGTFGLMGLLAAVAGIFTISELSAAAPDVGDLKELEAIAACVIGGASLQGGSGSIGLSVLGALVMASIKNGMSMMGIAAQMQKVILGSLLVVAVGLDQWSRRTKK